MTSLHDVIAEDQDATEALAASNLTQLACATIIAGAVKPVVLWHDGQKRWYSLDVGSGIWRPFETTDQMQLEIDDVLQRHARNEVQTDAYSASVTRALQRRLSMSSAEFDSDPWTLGVQNGVIELRTGLLRPARASAYITRQCPVDFDEDARCPRWLDHLARLFEGDDERVSWFQQAVGCSLVGDAREKDQVFIYLLGPPGNGKGTTMRTLVTALGQDQYAANINPADLVRDRHLAWMHRLKGTRLAVVEEVKNQRLDVSKLKSLTGADTIVANRMRQEDESWAPTHTFVMTANHAPIVDDVSGMARRYRPIQTGPSVAIDELDSHYEEAIREELPGILAWIVRGCSVWQMNGQQLSVLDSSRELASEHLAENDPFLEWGEQCVELDPDGWAGRAELISSFNWFAAGRGLRPLDTIGQRQMYEWLRQRDATDRGRAGKRGFAGVRVTVSGVVG